MSTRAQIGFYKDEHEPIATPGTVYIYRHYDGYPEGILPALLPFARSFHKRRGLGDTAYATARCLVALAQSEGAGEDAPEYLGLGATTTLYAGIAYFYHVSPTRIGVYAASNEDDDVGAERDEGTDVEEDDRLPALRLLHTVPLAPATEWAGLAAEGGAR